MNPVVLHHILLLHAISGWDTMSSVYDVTVEKKKALAVLESGNWDVLEVFFEN